MSKIKVTNSPEAAAFAIDGAVYHVRDEREYTVRLATYMVLNSGTVSAWSATGWQFIARYGDTIDSASGPAAAELAHRMLH